MLGKAAIVPLAVTFPGCRVGRRRACFRLRWSSLLSHQKLAVAIGGFLKLLRFVPFFKGWFLASYPKHQFNRGGPKRQMSWARCRA